MAEKARRPQRGNAGNGTPELSVVAPAPVGEAEQRRLIAEAAYRRAEQRGFTPGFEEQDWYEAEAEVRERLRRPPA